MGWTPATRKDVLNAIEGSWSSADPPLRAQLEGLLVDPQPIWVNQSGNFEAVFVVARIGRAVVFFDDVEDEFANATDREGQAEDVAFLGDIAFALQAIQLSNP